MKGITLTHPWPWTFVPSVYVPDPKDVENRKWTPPPSQLRPGDWLALHGGKYPTGAGLRKAVEDYQWMLDSFLVKPGNLMSAILTPYASAIFAVVHYTGTVTECGSRWFYGPYGWRWDQIKILPEPVSCRGAQKLWDVPAYVLERMRAQFRRVG